jgi:hypothetical protein
MRAIAILLSGLLVATPPAGSLIAQQSPSRLSSQAKGVTLDRFIYEGSGITAVSFRLSTLLPGAMGPELGVSLFPDALRARALLLASDFGPAYNIPLPYTVLQVKAGASAITGLGGGILFVPGFHVGGGLIVRIDDRTGVRIDAIRHYYQVDAETEPIWSIGFGFTSLPRGRSSVPRSPR